MELYVNTEEMTTVEFGGEPTLEARREFSNLKDGSQVPKYTGHVHQLRYRSGHTYGDETHRLASDFPHLVRSKSKLPIIKFEQSDPYQTREFPDGKLPGYTGYIPQRKYQFGNRYRVESETCLTGTKAAYERAKTQAKELRNTISAHPKTESLNSGTVTKHFLDYHRAYNPVEGSQQKTDRRIFVEAPIPGYKGYIPRIGPTDVAVGLRYHEAVKKSLNRFAAETTYSTTSLPTSKDSDSNLTSSSANFDQPYPTTRLLNQRLYAQSGMIPKYTGYLPQRKYRIGQTYGDTSRGLPICSHSFSNFGDFVRSKSSFGIRKNNIYL